MFSIIEVLKIIDKSLTMKKIFSIVGDIGMLLGMDIGIAKLTKLTKFSSTCFSFLCILNMIMYLSFSNICIT